VQNVKKFSNQMKKVTWHIHQKEMAAKSVGIVTNVIANNEHVFKGPIRGRVQE